MIKRKAALITGSTSGIGLGIAEQLAAKGCNIVLNGFGDPGAIQELRTRLARAHDVAEVAALTAFLVSEQAASITGAILPVDGGWTAH